jgi:UDP-N-acetylmuramoyl-L-alanyl-D-glutamate--2,6-diaminopimelate ligase
VIVVFGSAGLRDRQKRRMMGRIAGELADRVIVTAEDPRTENLEDILCAMAAGCRRAGAREGRDFERIPDRGQALLRAVGLAAAGDVVIACGKGHEQSMCFGHTEYPWDDRSALSAALVGEETPRLPTSPPSPSPQN